MPSACRAPHGHSVTEPRADGRDKLSDGRPSSPEAVRVAGLGYLPVYAVAGNAVGVVAIGRRGIEKYRYNTGQILGKAHAHGFPVLKDVAPVALIICAGRAVLVLRNDIEAVPRAGGVSVTARKADGEIFRGETVQIGVARLCSELMQLCRSAVLAECSAHRLGLFIRERAVMRSAESR